MEIPITSQEHAYVVSDEILQNRLKEHFIFAYAAFADTQLTEEAGISDTDGCQRCFTGIPNHFMNCLLDIPEDETYWNASITEQLHFFAARQMPFSWFIDEGSHEAFKDTLRNHGFIDSGTLQGVIGLLDTTVLQPELPAGYSIEPVEDEVMFERFAELACKIFEMEESGRILYKQALLKCMQKTPPTLNHWVAKKDGQIIAALSTFIHGDMVSFWNNTTLPKYRRQGINTAIRQIALQDAITRGCQFGAAYLREDCMAFGIFQKLGYTTKWRFNSFSSPVNIYLLTIHIADTLLIPREKN